MFLLLLPSKTPTIKNAFLEEKKGLTRLNGPSHLSASSTLIRVRECTRPRRGNRQFVLFQIVEQ